MTCQGYIGDTFWDPYKEAAQQLLEQAPRSPEYVPDPIELEDHVPAHISEHPEDLVPAEDEVPIEAYIPKVASAPTPPLPPSFLSPRIRPSHTRAAMAHMRAVVPSTYHSPLPSGTPPLLPIPLPIPSTSRRAEIPEADTSPRKRLLLTAPKPGCEVRESSAATARQPGPTMARSVDCSFVDTMETRFRDTKRRRMTDKYCPRGEIKKLETEMWELKTKGTDVIGYSRRFQELALMCDRIFPEESDRVEKYIDGLPDTIHDSVKATRPKTMQEAIEFATEMMDKRIRDVVEKNKSLRVLLETIRTSHIRIRGRTLAGLMS
nr:reverse transcriptase domain-containing protein [Tanacetum cinerariifolium]